MQIKIYTIPIPGGEALTEDMNVFLRSKKILQMENELVSTPQGAHWCFCIKYLEDGTVAKPQRIDYKAIMNEADFQRFSKMREIRKQLAIGDGVPPYAVFTDEELAAMVASESPLSAASMLKIKGVGSKKMEKYGAKFLDLLDHAG